MYTKPTRKTQQDQVWAKRTQTERSRSEDIVSYPYNSNHDRVPLYNLEVNCERGFKPCRIIIRADADTLDGLARGIRPALGIVTGSANERARLLLCGGVLQRTLWLGSDTCGDISRAARRGAVWRTHVAGNALDPDVSLVGLATVLGVLVVAGGRRWGRWRWRRSWAGAGCGCLGTSRVGWLHGDATLVFAAYHPEVALLTPGCTP